MSLCSLLVSRCWKVMFSISLSRHVHRRCRGITASVRLSSSSSTSGKVVSVALRSDVHGSRPSVSAWWDLMRLWEDYEYRGFCKKTDLCSRLPHRWQSGPQTWIWNLKGCLFTSDIWDWRFLDRFISSLIGSGRSWICPTQINNIPMSLQLFFVCLLF